MFIKLNFAIYIFIETIENLLRQHVTNSNDNDDVNYKFNISEQPGISSFTLYLFVYY